MLMEGEMKPLDAAADGIQPTPSPSLSWLAYQQLLDSALPVGGFSHSFGLETMVQEGRIRTAAQLRSYVENMMLYSWACGDALVVRAVYRDAPTEAWRRLWAVERQLHVQRTAMETRQGMEKMGRRMLALSQDIFPSLEWEPLYGAYKRGEVFSTHPLVHGYTAYRLGISEHQAIEGYLYTCVVSSVGSALRLMSIGQTEGQRLIAVVLPLMQEALRIAQVTEPEEAWNGMPMAELAMIRHETLYSRLFMS
jgi:urease accessory protein